TVLITMLSLVIEYVTPQVSHQVYTGKIMDIWEKW
ncbi:LOW QUALITY PROTEIN: hypothetical protein PanWU01x14_368260, partial [Parasponia andersonii]